MQPALPYPYSAQEPLIDNTTQMLHWSKHLTTYYENLNKAIAPFPALQVCLLSLSCKRKSCPCSAKDLVTFLHPEVTHPSLSMCLHAVSGPLPCLGLVHEQLLHSVHFTAPTQLQCVLGHNELGTKCGPQRIRMDQRTADLADADRAIAVNFAILMQVLTVEQMMPAVGTSSVPMNISKAVRNNAGGVYNHLLFFKVCYR